MNAKRIATAVVGASLLVGTATACVGTPPAPPIGQDVNSVTQIQQQGQNETVKAYNQAIKNVGNQYPASQMSNPLELKMLRERDLYLNDESQLQYIYIFPTGRPEIFFSSVKGKISTMTSQMTPTDGAYQYNTNHYDALSVPIPQDDLSYGGSPCGDNGIFWFDAQGGYHQACVTAATVMIESAPLKLSAIEMPATPMDPAILAKMKQK